MGLDRLKLEMEVPENSGWDLVDIEKTSDLFKNMRKSDEQLSFVL